MADEYTDREFLGELTAKAEEKDFTDIKIKEGNDEYKIRCWTNKGWTKKDGTEKKGLKPNELELGKTYKVFATGVKKPGWDYFAFNAQTMFRSDEKQQNQTLSEPKGNHAQIMEYVSEIAINTPENLDETNFILNYFASQFPMEVEELQKAYRSNF